MNLWAKIRADWVANHELRIRLFLVAFRVANAARRFGPLALPVLAAYKMISAAAGIELPSRTKVGSPLQIQHGFGLVVHGDTVIGDRCVLKQGVTLGIRRAEGPCPVVGDRVQFGPNAQVIGGVTIGDRALIGAGALVLDDVPADSVAVSPKSVVRPRVPAGP